MREPSRVLRYHFRVVRSLVVLSVVAGACFARIPMARADSAEPHVERGEALARDGRLTDAIVEFKRADAIEPRAKHACLIALAYIRRELWPQAEVFLATCHERAKPSDPLPDWVPLAEQQLDQRLASASVARVSIRVEPAAAADAATIEVSSFAPDELFRPRAIHLPLGKHLITARSPGRASVERAVEITDGAPREVVISFDRQEVHVTTQNRSHVPTVVIASGGAILVGAVAYHLLAFEPVRDDLASATDPAVYDASSSKFDSRRAVTLALYGVGAAVVVTGLVLRYTVYKNERHESPRLSAGLAASGRGLTVGVEWSR